MPLEDFFTTDVLDLVISAIGLITTGILQVLFDNFLTGIWTWFVIAFSTLDSIYGFLLVVGIFLVLFYWKYIPWKWGLS